MGRSGAGQGCPGARSAQETGLDLAAGHGPPGGPSGLGQRRSSSQGGLDKGGHTPGIGPSDAHPPAWRAERRLTAPPVPDLQPVPSPLREGRKRAASGRVCGFPSQVFGGVEWREEGRKGSCKERSRRPGERPREQPAGLGESCNLGCHLVLTQRTLRRLEQVFSYKGLESEQRHIGVCLR